MQRLIATIGLQMYALILALHQLSIGVRTDEAKYLLNIPYPHPPFARFIISVFDGWQYHELFWRIVFATLVIQSVWMVIDLVKEQKKKAQIAVALGWLLSGAVVIQSGTVMMAVLTALQALVLVWLFLREKSAEPYLVLLFWIVSLFTAYQAVLFGPLVLGILLHTKIGVRRAVVLCSIPVLLLALYTLINPLVPASMLNHAGKDAAETLWGHFTGVASLWLIAGSIIGSIIGFVGLFVRPKLELLSSLFLVSTYTFLSRYDYYAILFVPLLVAGIVLLLRRYPRFSTLLIVLMPVGLMAVLWNVSFSPASVIPKTYAAIASVGHDDGEKVILISGSFGHEWQYGTKRTVLRYQSRFLASAHAVICLQSCKEMQDLLEWKRLESAPVEVWMRQ